MTQHSDRLGKPNIEGAMQIIVDRWQLALDIQDMGETVGTVAIVFATFDRTRAIEEWDRLTENPDERLRYTLIEVGTDDSGVIGVKGVK